MRQNYFAKVPAFLPASKWLPEGGARTCICHIFTFDEHQAVPASPLEESGQKLHQTRVNATTPTRETLKLIDLGQCVKWWCGGGAALSRRRRTIKNLCCASIHGCIVAGFRIYTVNCSVFTSHTMQSLLKISVNFVRLHSHFSSSCTYCIITP